jgi:phosphate transport system permease protein
VLAVLIAAPVALGIAVFIAELAPARLQRALVVVTELLAAVPSIVYGLWGIFVLVPFVRQMELHTPAWLRATPFFKGPPLGVGMLAAAIVLAIMVIPFTSSIAREVLRAVPQSQREGAYALGATRWGMIRAVVLPFGKGGMIGGTMLGLGRAMGETIAVFMVISQVPQIQPEILRSGANSVSALIALRFDTASLFELSALMAAGLALFVLTLVVNFGASAIIARTRSGQLSDA